VEENCLHVWEILQRAKWNKMVMRRRIFQVDSFIFAVAENKEVDDDDDDDDPCGFSGKAGPVCQQWYLE
jgi:hypothetical protein